MDLPYTFYNPITSPDQTIVDGIGGDVPFFMAVAVLMQSYIANFVVYGNPNGAGPIGFPVYGDAQVLVFNSDLNTFVEDPTANERCTWWQTGAYMSNSTSL
jgi:carboxylesterase type B